MTAPAHRATGCASIYGRTSEMSNHQFNNFTGRLTNSTRLQPLYPVTPTPLHSTEPTKMIWDTAKTKPAKIDSVLAARYSNLPPKLVAAMKHFQQPGWRSKPVFLMGGTKDKVLYYTTWALFVMGGISTLDFFITHAPNK